MRAAESKVRKPKSEIRPAATARQRGERKSETRKPKIEWARRASKGSFLPRAWGGRGIQELAVWVLAVGVVVLTGCRREGGDPGQRASAAKALFERTTREFHLPSAEAARAERKRLEAEAVRGYQQVLKEFPEQEYWCAEALRSVGNIRAVQGNTNGALECWSQVMEKYPRQDWEVLMALKSSADLLWEANRRMEAKAAYQKIITQFDQTNAAPVVQTVVRGSKLKLEQ